MSILSLVRSEYLRDEPLFVCFIELVDTLGEKTESNSAVDVSRTALLHLACDIEHGITGRDHVIE